MQGPTQSLILYKNDANKNLPINMFYTSNREMIIRDSKDIVSTCIRGKALIELCTSAQMRIVNGRSIGDISQLMQKVYWRFPVHKRMPM